MGWFVSEVMGWETDELSLGNELLVARLEDKIDNSHFLKYVRTTES